MRFKSLNNRSHKIRAEKSKIDEREKTLNSREISTTRNMYPSERIVKWRRYEGFGD